jgi:hypothetical protein
MFFDMSTTTCQQNNPTLCGKFFNQLSEIAYNFSNYLIIRLRKWFNKKNMNEIIFAINIMNTLKLQKID